MIRITITSLDENKKFEHPSGPLEFGRGPRKDVERCVLMDAFVSRDHLQVEELTAGRIRLTNLSARGPVMIDQDEVLEPGACGEFDLPVEFWLGWTWIQISPGDAPADQRAAVTRMHSVPGKRPVTLRGLGDSPDAPTLARWFETVIAVQQAAAGASEFFRETARAVVDLVGLDRGLVLRRQGGDWEVAAAHGRRGAPLARLPAASHRFSRKIVADVVERRSTVFENFPSDAIAKRESLQHIEAVVAAPILDPEKSVVGIVYGSRDRQNINDQSIIRPLDAQVVQILAAAVGAGLARQEKEAEALRSQVQFEQFFSPQLARELARDPGLLEGRERVVTMLFTDLRDFTRLSEQLSPKDLFRVMQELMEMQTDVIRQHEGVVVDYYGDGLMAMWNSPGEQTDHAAIACRAAAGIMAGLPAVSDRWRPILNRSLDLGSGINTGTALVGNTGSSIKFKYGPMGPTVNVGSRVVGASKQLGVPILLTGATRAQLGDSFGTRRLGRARLAGVAEPVELYELFGEDPGPDWTERRDRFEEALAHFEAQRWAEACQSIYPLLGDSVGAYDTPSLNLLSRAVECLRNPPERFDPTLELRRK